MIPIKEAVEKAAAFAQGVLEAGRSDAILLEEVEPSTADGNEVWLITLSLPETIIPKSVIGGRRIYKTFTVDGRTGEVLSMKIRQLSGA